jgi:hypothetical protein
VTNWLLVLPRNLLPPGIGTLAADAEGLFIETLTDDDYGQRFTWQQVVDRLLSEPEPAPADPAAPAIPNRQWMDETEKRLADLERRVASLTATLGSLALSTTVHGHGERLARLETAITKGDTRP